MEIVSGGFDRLPKEMRQYIVYIEKRSRCRPDHQYRQGKERSIGAEPLSLIIFHKPRRSPSRPWTITKKANVGIRSFSRTILPPCP
jgi:hypothetical protein